MEPLYYNSVNADKRAEIAACFANCARPLRFLHHPVIELLDTDLVRLVRAKAVVAYQAARVPVVVEHGGLYIDHLGGLPGSLVKPIWESLGPRLADLLPPGERRAEVRSAVCYCDGRTRAVFTASLEGAIAPGPRGANGYHWHPIFVAVGGERTFAELSLEERIAVSPAATAYAALRVHLGV